MPHPHALHPASAGAPGRRWRSYLAIAATVAVAAAALPFVALRTGSIAAVLAAVGVLALISLVALPTPAKDARLCEQWSERR